MKRILTLLALVVALGFGASYAQDGNAYNPADYIDLGELELGKKYDLQAFKKYRGTYTPDFTGTIVFDSPELAFFSSYPPCWSEPDSPSYNMIQGTHSGYGSQGSIYNIAVEEGKTIYLSSALLSIMSTKYLLIDKEAALDLVSTSPEEGAYYSYTGDGLIEFYFNAAVQIPFKRDANENVIPNAHIKVLHLDGNDLKTYEADVMATAMQKSIAVHCQDQVREWILSGAIAKDDPLVVTIPDVTDAAGNRYKGTGEVSATFKVPAKAVDLLLDQCTVPALYKSFNPVDKPLDLVLVFDGKVSSCRPMIEFGFKGSTADGMFYAEEVPASQFEIKDNTITVHLADGQVRRPDHEMALQVSISEMNVMVTQVKDEVGNYANSEGIGTQGQFNFTIPFEYVKIDGLATEYTPAAGSSLQGVNEMKIWVSELKNIEYTGIKFTHSNGEVVVPKDQTTTVMDEVGNGGEITLAVPAEIQGARQISVTFDGLFTPDGLDHSKELLARYDGFDIIINVVDAQDQTYSIDGMVPSIKEIKVSAADFDGNAMPVALSNDYYISLFNLNREEYALTCSVTDGVLTAAPAEVITETGRYPFMIGAGSLLVGENKLANDRIATAIEIPSSSYNAELDITVDPAPGRTYAELPSLTIMFHNKSDIGVGNGLPTYTFNGGEPVKLPDLEGDWDVPGFFTLQTNFTEAGKYVISFPEGYLMYQEGDMAFPAFSLEYTIDAPEVVFNVIADPADKSDVKTLSSIVLDFPDYDSVGLGAGHATIAKKDGEPVNLPDADMDWDIFNRMIQRIDPAVTESGTYTVTFPAGYFLLGDMGDEENPTFTLTYGVGATGVEGIVAENESVTVYDAAGRCRLENAKREALNTLPNGFYIINGKKAVICK